MVGAPELGDDLALGHGFVLLAAILAAPIGIGLLIEPWIHAWSDRVDRRPLLVASLAGMAVFPVAAAFAHGPIALGLLIGLWGMCAGIAGGIAQAVLVGGAASPEAAMTRWTLSGAIGDVAAPLLLGALALVGQGWRAGLVVAAVIPLVAALGALRSPLPPPVADDEAEEPIATALATALRDPRLLGWLVASTSCTLMDELLLVLVALRLDGSGHTGSLQLAALVAGEAVGILAAERSLTRWSPRAVLLVAAALSALALGAWLRFEGPVAGTLLLGLLGAASAVQWPLTKAAAFARYPRRPGLVNAVDHVLGTADVAAPLIVGAIASAWGIEAALVFLLLQPACVALVAAVTPRGA